MISIIINGLNQSIESSQTVADVLTFYFESNPKPQLFSVAINQQFVAQGLYQTTLLADGDSVDIFSPIQGG